MSKQPIHEPLSPIKRVVEKGGIYFGGEHLRHDALRAYEGQLVLCDLEKDVDTEELNFRIYSVNEEVVCLLKIADLTAEQICTRDHSNGRISSAEVDDG